MMMYTRFYLFFLLFWGVFFLFSCERSAEHSQRLALAAVQGSLMDAGEELGELASMEMAELQFTVDRYPEYMPLYELTEPLYPALYVCREQIEKAQSQTAKAENAFELCVDLQKAYFAMKKLHRQIAQTVRYASTRLDCSDVEAFLASIAPIEGGQEAFFLMLCRWEHDACYAVFQAMRWLNDAIENTELAQPKAWRIQARYTPVFAQKNAEPNAFLQRGDSLRVWAMLRSYAPTFSMALRVNGQEIAAAEDKFYYEIPTAKLGEHKYTATARLENPFTGRRHTLQRDFFYKVVPNPLPK